MRSHGWPRGWASWRRCWLPRRGSGEAGAGGSEERGAAPIDTLHRRMRIGVPKETADGERRVALVPEVVRKLSGGLSGDAGSAVDVLVQRGAGDGALIPDAAFEDAGAQLVDDAAATLETDVVVKVAAPTRAGDRSPWARLSPDRVSGALTNGDRRHGDRGDGRDELRARGGAADQPRAVDGRAVVAGEHLGLPRGADRRSGAGALLPDADDRGGDDPSGDGAGARGRGRGVAGDRDGPAARRGGPGVRRAGGGQGAGRVARARSSSSSIWAATSRAQAATRRS